MERETLRTQRQFLYRRYEYVSDNGNHFDQKKYPQL